MFSRRALRAPGCPARWTVLLWPALLALTWSHALQAQNDERILLAACIGEPGSGNTHVSGVVTNSVTGSPLTGARIEAVSSGGTVLTETHAQIGGEYRLCKLPSAPGLALRAVFGTNEGGSVPIPGAGPQFMDLTVPVSDPVTIMGTVLDNATQQPLEGVWVALSGTRFSTVTNAEGKFSFLDVPPGNHVLESNQIGYAFRADSLTLLRHALGLRIALSEQAIPLNPITVTGTRDRSALRDAEIARIGNPFASRFEGITPSEVDEMRPRAVDALYLIENSIPSIRIVYGRGAPCVERTRSRNTPGCQEIAVYVDDIHMPDPGDLRSLVLPSDISHMQFMPPLDALARYGATAENGVLLIYTR